jgi:hypothetical protein
MSRGLEIPPHSRRLSGLAVAGLLVLAVGGFTAGLTRQLQPPGVAPFPPPQPRSDLYAKAPTAQPVLPAARPRLASRDTSPQPAAPDVSPDATPALQEAATDPTDSAAATPPAADASATVPDAPADTAPPPSPQSSPQPSPTSTPDPPTADPPTSDAPPQP